MSGEAGLTNDRQFSQLEKDDVRNVFCIVRVSGIIAKVWMLKNSI